MKMENGWKITLSVTHKNERMQKMHITFEEVVLAACTAYINEGGGMQEWPAGTANEPR